MTTKESGAIQAEKPAKPKKTLNNGVDPQVGAATQFQPGQSGNPAGKPPGTKHLSTWIQDLLNDEDFKTTLRQGLQITEYKGAPIKAIVSAQIALAVQGDHKAFDLLSKYGYGAKLDVTTNGDSLNNPYAGLTTEELRKLAQGK